MIMTLYLLTQVTLLKHSLVIGDLRLEGIFYVFELTHS